MRCNPLANFGGRLQSWVVFFPGGIRWGWASLGDFCLVLRDFRVLFPGFVSGAGGSWGSTPKFEIFTYIISVSSLSVTCPATCRPSLLY